MVAVARLKGSLFCLWEVEQFFSLWFGVLASSAATNELMHRALATAMAIEVATAMAALANPDAQPVRVRAEVWSCLPTTIL